MASESGVSNGVGNWMMVVASLAAVAVAVFDYLNQGNGIAGSGGALVVVVSSALLLAASLILALALVGRRWLRITVDGLLCLGIIGTGLAAYMLEAGFLLAVMALAVIGWFVHLFGAPSTAQRAATLRPELA